MPGLRQISHAAFLPAGSKLTYHLEERDWFKRQDPGGAVLLTFTFGSQERVFDVFSFLLMIGVFSFLSGKVPSYPFFTSHFGSFSHLVPERSPWEEVGWVVNGMIA